MDQQERSTQRGPLEGLRVLDLGSGIAGSFGATLLADFGAEVIKVELPGEQDFLRQIKPLYQGVSLSWITENRNKKSILLDLTTDTGRSDFKRLVKISDIVMENFGPHALEQWGLGYEELKAINEKIVLIRISSFGQKGPYSQYKSNDSIASAMGGLTYLTGYPDGPPVRTGVSVSEYLTGIFAALGALLAIYYRDAKGKGVGQWVDLALYGPLLRISEFGIPAFHRLGTVRERFGNQHPSGAPSDNFRTKDNKWVYILAPLDHIFTRLARAMGQEELSRDPRFSNPTKRAENYQVLNFLIAQWVESLSREEVLQRCIQAEVPISPIYSIRDIAQDPHYQVRGNIIELEDPSLGKIRMQGIYPHFSLTPGQIRHIGPPPGQHTDEIYRELLEPLDQGTVKRSCGEDMSSSIKSRERPLEGLRILDLGSSGAGPIGPTILAEFGAEVIKIEEPSGARSLLRNLTPFLGNKGVYWILEGRNKKCITLDLKKPLGQAILKELAAISDIVLEDFRPGTLKKWNLNYEELRKVNPRIIMVSVSAFGQTGPYSNRVGYDMIGLGFGGMTYLTGTPDTPPVRPGLIVADYVTACFNALATLMALYYRDIRKSGQGQRIELSLYESVFRLAEFTVAAYHKLNLVKQREGNRYYQAILAENFLTQDGHWVAISCQQSNEVSRMLKLIGREDLIPDSSLDQESIPIEVYTALEEWISGNTLEKILILLQESQIPAAKIYSFKDIVEDPHYGFRGDIVEVDDPELGKIKLPGVFPKLSLTPGRVEHIGANLGQHNDEIYGGLLGYSQQQLAQLKSDRVI